MLITSLKDKRTGSTGDIVANPLTMEDTTRGVTLALRLFLRDGDAARSIDDSYEGAVKSFWCAAIVLPFYFLYLSLLLGMPGEINSNFVFMVQKAGLANAAAVKTIAYAIGWVAWPLVMHHLAPVLGCNRQFFRYIVAYNWMSVVTTVLLLGYGAVLASGLVGRDMAILIGFSVAVLFWAYHWFIIRVTLDVGGAVAVGLVMADFAVAAVINDIGLAVAL